MKRQNLIISAQYLPRRSLAWMVIAALFSIGCNKTETASEDGAIAPRKVESFFPDDYVAPAVPKDLEEKKTVAAALNNKPEFLEIIVTNSTMVKDSTQELLALAVMPNKSKRYATNTTTWSSEAPDIADFMSGDQSPSHLTAKRSGQTRITAKFGDAIATTVITVTEATFSYMEITPTNIFVGAQQKFTARAIYSNGTSQVISDQVTWTSSLPAMASQVPETPAGTFLATAPGTFILSVAKDGASGSVPIKVQLMELDLITIEAPPTALALGASATLKAIGKFKSGATADVTEAITWTSSAPTIIEASDTIGTRGKVTAKNGGTAIISGSAGKTVGTVALTVQTVQFASIKIGQADKPIPKGLTKKLSAIGVLAGGAEIDITKDVTWFSSNPYLASISNDVATVGEITAFSPGVVTVSVLYGQGATQVNFTIIDATIVSVTVTGPVGSVECGIDSPQLGAVGLLSDRTEADITNLVTWSSTAVAIASVSNDPATRGILTALKAGTTIAKAQYFVAATGETVVGERTVEIGNPKLLGYDIVAPQVSFPVGTSMQLIAKGKYSCPVPAPEIFTSSVTWSSTNPKVAVSNVTATKGFLTSPGPVTVPETTKIRAVKGTLSGEVDMDIRTKEVKSISMTASNDRVDTGATVQLYVNALYSDNSAADITAGLLDHTLIFTTNFPGMGLVDDTTGVLTGVSEGYFTGSTSLTTPRGVTLSASMSLGTQSVCTTGVRRDLYCWFMGALNENCSQACAAISGSYRPATETFVGSTGNGNNCAMVLGAFGFMNLNKDNQAGPAGEGVGCAQLESGGLITSRRYSTPATTISAFHPSIRRICACSQ